MSDKSPDRLPTPEETAQTLAETDKVRAETAKLVAEAKEAEAKAKIAQDVQAIGRLHREEIERGVRKELADNVHHRIYLFSGAVAESSVKSCIRQLTEWHRLFPGESMELVFTSPGGSIIDGLALYDYIQSLRRAGHHITTSTLGMAASMAGILLQAGDIRVMSPEAWLLIHEAAFGTSGKIGEVEDTVTWVKKIQERILTIFVSRSHMTRAQIKNKWLRKDWWIDSDEALKLGLIDEIR